ncbi:MAG TPA: ATP-binding protein [Anaeromyxobacteraceae bacterium]|nr:ATP-binding protein [Anaeromyxobacteraceae bacterium]
MPERSLVTTTAEDIEQLLLSLPILLFVMDREDRVIDFRVGTGMRLQNPWERFHGKRVEESLPPNVASALTAGLARARATGAPQIVDYEFNPVGRQAMHYEARVAVFADGRASILVTDVTERYRLEEAIRQAQKLDSIGRLAGGVAHDFNNLLTVILSCAESLAAGIDAGEPARAEDVEEIRNAGARARDLTRQLLMFARREVVAPAILDLNDLVRRTEKLLRRIVGEDVEVAVNLDPAVWPIRADPSHLEQIVMNLAGNARDAMPRGGTLALETANVLLEASPEGGVPAAGDFVRLRLRDSGVGMSPEVKAHLFEPFFTTKGAGRGTGLGLSTVYGLVRQMGGHVLVESEPGRGTTFDVYVPRAAGRIEPPAESAAAGSTVGSETVLVVEDEAAVRSTAVRALRGAGYRVLVAATGREALALAAGPNTPDLLLTDVVMPEMDGRAVAEALQRRNGALRILYMSGYTQDAVVQRGVLDGGMRFLQKPFTPTGLLSRVREVLDAE